MRKMLLLPPHLKPQWGCWHQAKTNLAVFLGSSSSHAQPAAPAMPFMSPGLLNQPFNHLHERLFGLKQEFGGVASSHALYTVWLHDPRIKDIAKQIEKDPSFNKMAEQFQQTFDVKRQYFLTMEQQVMQNPQLMKMAKSLGTFIMQKLQQLDEEVKAIKAELMSMQKQQQLKQEEVMAEKAKLTSIQEESHQIDMVCEAARAELRSILEERQHDEQFEALKARLMYLREKQQEQQEWQQLNNHAIFTRFQSVATAEQEVAAEKQRTAALEQRIAALEPMIAAMEQEISMANDHTEPTRTRAGVRVAVTIGVFSHIYR
ncbi:hypothetical protein HanXRQr2_Chr10g0442861 [Helianthus annuus]|uniref:Uncharacterized protein n=1 Tax=Helianthus annuus TaxID=4232 RepID=A0A9K3HXY6_HELAN|nr:hypothetical protein HanXRQr2_Chr10g0442861 [Helianthus annuus]KAJ0530110.1 hypothetical protein HanHA89_Chr10g0385871 [Helianthus annuus]